MYMKNLKDYFYSGYNEKLTLDYLEEVIKLFLGSPKSREITIVSPYKSVIELPPLGEQSGVLFVFLDEFNQIYRQETNYDLIVTTLGGYETRNIIPITLGYCHRPKVDLLDLIPTNERFYETCFMGWRKNRYDFVLHANEYQKSKIKFFDNWSGRQNNQDDYWNTLKNTKYSLCPLGAMTPCYRFYESMMVGAIPVSTVNPWPWIKNIPMILTTDWSVKSVQSAIDEQGKDITSEKVVKFYEEYLSPEAQVSRIIKKL